MRDGVYLLCTPSISVPGDVAGVDAPGGREIHLHHQITPLDDLDDRELTRCACHIYQVDAGELFNVINFTRTTDYLARPCHYNPRTRRYTL